MQRNLVGLGVLVALAVACGFGGWWLFHPASASPPPGDYVAVVNGEAITRADWANQVAIEKRARSFYPKADVANLNVMIDTILVRQAAARDGLTCSSADGQQVLDEQYALNATAAAGSPDAEAEADAAISSMVLDGELPPDYLNIPEAERTPSGPVASATYWASPKTLRGYTDGCTEGKERHAFEDKQPPGVWMKNLRAEAHIVLAKGVVLATPTSIPTPLPSPHLGCDVQFACPNDEGVPPKQ